MSAWKLTCCVILGKEHDFSELCFCHLSNAINNTLYVERLQGLHTQYMKCLVYHRGTVHGQCLRSGSLGNKLRDGDLPAGSYLGSAHGIHACELGEMQDWTEGAVNHVQVQHAASAHLRGPGMALPSWPGLCAPLRPATVCGLRSGRGSPWAAWLPQPRESQRTDSALSLSS